MPIRGIGIFLGLLILGTFATGQEPRKPSQGHDHRSEKKDGRKRAVPNAPIPEDVAVLEKMSIVLGCPTDQSITVNLLSNDRVEGFCEYGFTSANYARKTELFELQPGKPADILLDRLPPDKRCFYRFCYRKPGEKTFHSDVEHSFHTQRSPGSSFTFEIQGDSHPERPHQYDPALYAQTLRSAAADHPDFYMAIGDDFSVDTLPGANEESIGKIYLNQRCFLGLVAQSAPLFLVNGNHEQAAACNLNGTPNNVAVWTQTARNKFFSQPTPDRFYSGDAKPMQFIGQLRDYYAWTWGDALFIVIDPYWHSPTPVDNVYGDAKKPHRDLWEITLGDDQYAWFERTLEESKSKFKFVFAHHVLGTGRGGIENADLFEWGGRNKKGVWEFDKKRPSWKNPIHQLMVKNGVTIFFQGHDHVFARQQLDGVIYQTLPQPADPNYSLFNREAFNTGEALPNSGRVRVTVSDRVVKVEYVRSWLKKDETERHKDGEIAFQYSISEARANSNDR